MTNIQNTTETLIGKKVNGIDLFTAEMSGNHWIGYFNCSNNNLTSLEGAPSSVSGYFDCSHNKLTSLEGAPSSVSGIGGDFDCSRNNLTSLHDIHKIVKKINGSVWAENNPIASCVLGVLLIEGCRRLVIDNHKVEDVVNKYLPNTRGFSTVIECQSELLDAGFDEYAKF